MTQTEDSRRRIPVAVTRPPNFEQIVAVSPSVRTTFGVIFAYDGVIYNPDNVPLTPSLIAHERVHLEQQKRNPVAWWSLYLSDPEFRFVQEVEAHVREYQVECERPNASRPYRKHMAKQIAKRLSGPIYGHMVTFERAKRLITGKDRL